MPKSSNGVLAPSFMYGTAWKKDATTRLVEAALKAGFRAIDTANQLKHYDEALVGAALKQAYQSGTDRKSLFLQTKFTYIDGQDHRLPYDPKASFATQVNQSFESSLKHLHTDYIDSFILHGPSRHDGLGAADWEVWGAIEQLYESGRAKVIGVSNVSPTQLGEFCSRAKIKPMMVQNRCFAVNHWERLTREICSQYGIIYQGFSLLTANPQVLQDSFVRSIAQRLNATPAQIVFRFSQMIGMLPLTGTTNPQHMAEDLASESLQLAEEEVAEIESSFAR